MGNLVLITGTSSGIGLSTSIECAAAGHRVVATMRDLEKRTALDAAAKARGVTVHVEQLDVTAENVVPKIRELVLKYGPFYGLVNNAGSPSAARSRSSPRPTSATSSRPTSSG